MLVVEGRVLLTVYEQGKSQGSMFDECNGQELNAERGTGVRLSYGGNYLPDCHSGGPYSLTLPLHLSYGAVPGAATGVISECPDLHDQ